MGWEDVKRLIWIAYSELMTRDRLMFAVALDEVVLVLQDILLNYGLHLISLMLFLVCSGRSFEITCGDVEPNKDSLQLCQLRILA